MLRAIGIWVAVAAILVPEGDLGAQMPADSGQVWKTYDIAPFVKQAGVGSQRHVVDWVLQDTGYPAWHGAVAASLSADDQNLRCFHTPDMQIRVEETVRRFVGEVGRPHRFQVRVLALGGPGWRADVRPALTAIPTATPGVQAWITSRENAAAVVGSLRARSDCQELPTGPVLAANGLPAVLAGGRKQPYVQDIAPRPEVWPGWLMQNAACDEGFLLDVQPLITADGTAVEAAVRCRIDQIERMAPVALAAPAATGQRVQVEVPQVAAVRVGERFRWPSSQTLIIGLGLVPWPVPGQNGAAAALLSDPTRKDVIVVVEPRLGGP